MTNVQRLPNPNYILLMAIMVYAILWSFYPHAFSSSDPALYSYRAYETGEFFKFGEGIVFDHRLGVTLPVAVIYQIFGLNIITTHLWSLLTVFLIFSTVWFALPNIKSRVIGLALCFFSVPLLAASATLLPDVVATAFMGFATLLLFKRQKIVASRFWLWLSILAVLSLFMAFLAKLSVYWILPLWILYFIRDLRAGDKTLLKKFYLPLISVGIVLGAGYLLFCNYVWGDPLARFKAVQDLTGQHLWSTGNYASMQFIKRMTLGPAKVLFDEYFLLPLLVLASFWAVPQKLKGWTFYVILCIGFFWFGTTSFTQYEPMPLSGRMVLPALPGIYILSAFIISKVSFSFSRFTLNKIAVSFIFLTFLLLSAVKTVRQVSSIDLHESRAVGIVKQKLADYPSAKYILICSDYRNSLALSFYFSFVYPENLNVVYIKNLDKASVDGKEIMVYVDEKKSNFLQSSYGKEEYAARMEALNLNEIYDGGYIHLFELKDKDELEELLSIPE